MIGVFVICSLEAFPLFFMVIPGRRGIWMDRTSENYQRLKDVFGQFGMSVFDMTEENFLSHPNWDVFIFGVPPVAIDIMVSVKGLNFDKSFERAMFFEDDDITIRTIHRKDLISAKKHAGRSKDMDDLENLE